MLPGPGEQGGVHVTLGGSRFALAERSSGGGRDGDLAWHSYPLGATWDGRGTNFALFSEVAERVELCLFDAEGETRIDLTEVDGFVWHGYMPGCGSGNPVWVPCTRTMGPRRGPAVQSCQAAARSVCQGYPGRGRMDDALFGYDLGFSRYRPSATDSAPCTMRSVVVNPVFDWGADRPPRIPYHETVIYEAHVRGLTLLHPQIPHAQRGTYAGLPIRR